MTTVECCDWELATAHLCVSFCCCCYCCFVCESASAAMQVHDAGMKREVGRPHSYRMIAVSPWRMVMLSVDRCISTLRTGKPVGMRQSSLKKDACNCLQHDLRPTCILKHRNARFDYRSKGLKGGGEGWVGRKVAVQTSRKRLDSYKSKAVLNVWVTAFFERLRRRRSL